jgi:hypothetical protein
VSRQVRVTLLETVVLLDKVQVIPADDNGALHLGGGNDTAQNATADGDIANEGALLVNVGTSHGGVWGLEAQSDLTNEAGQSTTTLGDGLSANEDGRLLLVGTLVLETLH